ncbi:phosphotransferase family protein [Sphingomonas sp. TF3]|nr:phosphotransferase family protein [Sphingomonas sp. TF3]
MRWTISRRHGRRKTAARMRKFSSRSPMTLDREQRLTDWLRTQPAFGERCEIASLQPLAGGQSSELLSFHCRRAPDLLEERFVVRFEQRGNQLFLTPDIVREYRMIDGVARHSAVPVAAMMGVEGTGEVLGAPFLVMRHIEGRAPLGRPSMHVQGLLTELDSEQRTMLAFNGLDAVAGIHAIDWRHSHPFLVAGEEDGRGIDRHLRQLAVWYRWAAAGRAFPITDQALDYLLRHRPGLHDEDDVLLWGDARPGNILFRPDRSIAAVLDWEGALVGPRSLDIGYWIMMDRFHAESIGMERLPGWPSEAEVIRHYCDAARAEVHDLDYFILLGAFFIATTLIRATDIGIEAGRLPADTQMAHANTATQIVAERLGIAVPPLSPEFSAHRGLAPAPGASG